MWPAVPLGRRSMSDEDAGHDLYDTSAEDYAAGYRDGQREAWANPPPGYRLVPEVPTEEMIEAFYNGSPDGKTWTRAVEVRDGYRAMLDAAPGAPKKEEGK